MTRQQVGNLIIPELPCGIGFAPYRASEYPMEKIHKGHSSPYIKWLVDKVVSIGSSSRKFLCYKLGEQKDYHTPRAHMPSYNLVNTRQLINIV